MNETNVDQQPSDATSDNSSNAKPLTDQGINERIVQKIRSCIDEGTLSSADVDSRVCEQLRSFPSDAQSIDSVFDEFLNSDFTGVVNKSAFLCNLIKQWKLRNPQASVDSLPSHASPTTAADSSSTKPGPDETKLKVFRSVRQKNTTLVSSVSPLQQILDRTKYPIEITAGQRKYGGPPPDGPAQPAHNSEVNASNAERDERATRFSSGFHRQIAARDLRRRTDSSL